MQNYIFTDVIYENLISEMSEIALLTVQNFFIES